MNEPIPLVVASDANFLFGLQTTVASAVLHEKHPIEVHLLDDGMLDWQWDSLVATTKRLNPRTRLTRHRLTPSLIQNFHTNSEYTATAYARILAPHFVPGPFAIYIDSDFVISKPISQLLPYLDAGKAIAAAQQALLDLTWDCPWSQDAGLTRYPYFNTGVMLLNLDKWRKDGIAETLLSFLEKESARCKSLDQTAMNWLLKDDVAYLPAAWNTLGVYYESGEPKPGPGEVNLHFASGLKPWKRRLPSLSHRIWWLFNRMFPPATPPPNPLFRPKNLPRYLRDLAKTWGRRRGTGEKGELSDWKRYWEDLSREAGLPFS